MVRLKTYILHSFRVVSLNKILYNPYSIPFHPNISTYGQKKDLSYNPI